MEFTLDQLRTFAEIARDGSFSRAAERRHLSQPAVSHQIRELERRVGAALFERVGKRVTLTAAGDLLLEHVSRVHEELSVAADRLRGLRGGLVGRLRLGTGATAATYLLPAVLEDFQNRWPRVEWRVVTGNSRDMARAVRQNELDVAFVTLPVPMAGLSIATLVSDELVGITAVAPGKRRRVMTPQEFKSLPLILYEPEGTTRDIVEAWLGRAKRRRAALFELGSVEAIKRMVRRGLGASIVPSVAVRDEVARGELSAVSLQPPLRRQLGIVTRTDRRDNALIRAFRDSVVAQTK
jgi:DNA-binding transcriptional LysR family regulator